MVSITDFKDVLISKSGGKPLSKVSNFYSILWQAMSKVKRNVDLPSAMRTVQLTTPVYSDVRMYPLPSDMSLNGIVALRPIVPDNSYYDYNNLNQRQFNNEVKFDYNTYNKMYGIRNINGVQYLLINDITTTPVIIQTCESLTALGTVAVLGVSTGLAVDPMQKIAGSGSFSFSNGIGALNGLSGTLLAAIDLSSQRDILTYVYLPTLTNVTGIQIGLGQDSSNYYTGAIATDFFGNALKVGWNLVRIPKDTFSITAGAPTWTGVDYWRIEILGTAVAATAGFRVDSITANLGELFEIDYYSDYQFVTAAGTRIVKPTQDSDLIVISGDEIDLFTDQFIEIMTVDLKQQGVTIDFQAYGGNKLLAGYEMFKFKFPSQRQLMKTVYGTTPQGRINE